VIFQDVVNFARKISGNFTISISLFLHTQCCTTENEVRMAPPWESSCHWQGKTFVLTCGATKPSGAQHTIIPNLGTQSRN
jgi:hypothetical protein